MAASNSHKSPPEPVWVSAMPDATGLWSMILTFRERDSHEMADRLEAAAEKQWEVHLRTQSIMNRSEKLVPLQTCQPTRLKTTPRDELKTQRKSKHENEKHVGNEIQQENTLSCDIDKDKNKERIINENCTKYPSVKLEHHPSPITSSTTSPRSLSANSAVESSCSRLALPQNNNDLDCYNCYNSRLKSYEKSKFRWDSPSPSQLSEAGFFFIGPRDKVQCFSCEVRQNQWRPAEDPWVRHTRHSPLCDYIRETRGADFISTILSKMEKVKNGIINTYSRSNSNNSMKNTDGSEFAKMKLRSTKKVITISGWQLDPYKERGVGKKKK